MVVDWFCVFEYIVFGLIDSLVLSKFLIMYIVF